MREYALYKTARKTAKENNLTPAESTYYSGQDLFYDFSLLDSIDFSDNDRSILESDLMNYHAVAWFEQPMPTIICFNNFTHYIGQFQTAAHRIYRNDGKRIMVIIEIVSIDITRENRTCVYDEFKPVFTYTAHNHNHECDYEIPA